MTSRWLRRVGAPAAALVSIFVVLVAVIPDGRISAYPSAGRDISDFEITENILGTVDLFDPSVVHTVELNIDEDDYLSAVRAFGEDGTRLWIRGDAVIDAARVANVGLRLKGSAPFAMDPLDPTDPEPQDASWLLSFDEFDVGRRYQGHEELALRVPGGNVAPVTGLNEVLSLAINDLAGEPALGATYLSLSVNDGPTALRLAVQNPGQSWVDDDFNTSTLNSDGVLYKALRDGRFEYCGPDPLAYDHSFRQVTQRRVADLAPLIRLLQWEDQADDDTFASELHSYVDVDSFARYLAVHHAVLDTDDMSGPGQNYYLWYANDTEKFTVLTWDADLTFAQDPALEPLEPVPTTPAVTQPTEPGGTATPSPCSGTPVGTGHPLKDRFLNDPDLRQRYLAAYAALVDDVLASGAAATELDRWEQVLRTVDPAVVDPLVVETEAARVRLALTTRVAGLLASSQLSMG